LIRWIDLANVEKDFDGLMNLIVREQYLGGGINNYMDYWSTR